MSGLAVKRCLNHDGREAVCRCPSCTNFFCRECVILFEARLICAVCLSKPSNDGAQHGVSRLGIKGLMFTVGGLAIAWFLFYTIGWLVLQFRERAPLA